MLEPIGSLHGRLDLRVQAVDRPVRRPGVEEQTQPLQRLGPALLLGKLGFGDPPRILSRPPAPLKPGQPILEARDPIK